MSILPHLIAGAGSSIIRIFEKFLPISNDAESYLNHEINFEEATNSIVKNIRIYVPLTTSKIICDAILSSLTCQWIYDLLINIRSIFKDLIGYGLQAFLNGITSAFTCFVSSLRNCTISLIATQCKRLLNPPQPATSAISLMSLCNISNTLHIGITSTKNGFTKTVQIELMKYWLECMGIIRAIAEYNNINFVKYMKRSCEEDIHRPMELQWTSEKDLDFKRVITVSLEDIFHGTNRVVTVQREIRDSNKRTPDIEKATYDVIIPPGCPDGKTFRFIEAGHRDPVNIPADLVVEIQTEKHPLYERLGSDLIYKAKISLNDALAGMPVQIPSIDGSTKECNPRGVINPNTQIIVDHAGLPDPTNNEIRGRLIVKFDIEFPDTITGIEPLEQNI